MLFSRSYAEFDPNKKNPLWMADVISQFRLSGYNPLIDRRKAAENRLLINSEHSMENIKLLFKNVEDLEKAGFEFTKISIIEKIKNILTAERQKAEIKAYVDAQDPSLERLKKEDMELLKNKKFIDKTVNELKLKSGLPPSNVSNEDFNGNYDAFEQMGLNSMDAGDIETFFQVFYHLDTEIDFQKAINHVFLVNCIEDNTFHFIEDATATKAMAMQQFINKLTGQIVVRRIMPENIFRVKGENGQNQKSDVAVGYYEKVTVQEFLKRVGDTFNFVNEFMTLLMGVNSYSNSKYSAIEMTDGSTIGDIREGQTCKFADLMNYNVEIGYIEWKSIDAVEYRKFVNEVGNTKFYKIDETKKNSNEYIKEAMYRERTYKAHFLTTSTYTQYVFDGGLLYHQETEGQEDEFSNYSIKYIKYEGQTVADIAKPWINMAQTAFTKFNLLLREAKKDGTAYNLESLQQIAKGFMGADGGPASVKQVFDMLENATNEIWSFPIINGQAMQTQSDMNKPIIRNFDSKFKNFKDIVDWAVSEIISQLGFNDLRNGETPSTNDVYKLEKASLEQSSNATFYIDKMFDSIYKNTAITTLSFVNDIIRYKDSLPYKYLLNILGEDGISRLNKLPKIAPHRMDIFVSSFANISDRIRVLQDTDMAYQKGIIDYATKILINSTNDHRKAQKLLMIKEQKGIKLKREEVKQQQDFEMQMQDKKTQSEMEIIKLRGGLEIQKAQIQAQGYIAAAEINANARQETVKVKSEANKEEARVKDQLEQQKAFGVDTAI